MKLWMAPAGLHIEPAQAKDADAVAKLGLHHVVVTSVDRDDLKDGGAEHFSRTIAAIRRASPGTTVEILDGLKEGERVISRGSLFIDRMSTQS